MIEATLSPIFTRNNWIYSIANFQEAMAFNFCGFPLPRAIRAEFIKHLFWEDNFRKLIFWSKAGKATLNTYGGVTNAQLLEKVEVVYPAIRTVSDEQIQYNKDHLNLLFSGDFFRKGGANVIDAFEKIQKSYSDVTLILCCDEKFDFITKNISLRNEYLNKIKANKKIDFRGRIPRDEMINTVLPQTDIYLLPTYAEAFGYAILEAMAYGIPVISTNLFAIPEMVEHEKTGYLIDVSSYNCEKLFKGYVVTNIPEDFKEHVTVKLSEYLCLLLDSFELRKMMGASGLKKAREEFSFKNRNTLMSDIYKKVL